MDSSYQKGVPKIIMRSPMKNMKFNYQEDSLQDLRQRTQLEGWPISHSQDHEKSLTNTQNSIERKNKKRLGQARKIPQT